MKSYNILIVEDEFINAQFIEKAIIKLGHNVVATVETACEAMEIVEEETIHIIFMDINLEGSVDGIQCAKAINQDRQIPIIYTTAFADTETIDEANDTNLFGYLIKPFDHRDIEASLKIAITQNYRAQTTSSSNNPLFKTLRAGYKYYPQTKTLMHEETNIKLTKKESETFYCLFRAINQTVTTDYLSEHIWEGRVVSSSSIRNTVMNLRRKVPDLTIRTVSGIGYTLEDA